MSDAEHQILNLAAKKLKQCLDVDGILMSLVSAEVISHEDSMRIRAAPSFDRCTALLDVLYRKENFLNVFLYTLIESNQSHIVEHINEFLPTVHLPPIDIQATKTARLHESAARVSAANTPSFLRFKKGDEFHDAELKIHDVEFAPDEVDNLVVHGGLLGKDIGTYDYNRDQRKARILMINNIKFDYAEDRLGADKDKESLGILCEKVFPGIKPMYHENKKAHEMEQVLKKFADSVNESKAADVQAIFIFIMTHGHNADILGTDGESIPLLDVFKFFGPDACPNLSGKPKVFFIQACRGDDFDIAAIVPDQHDGIGGSKAKQEKISQLDDFLVAFSSGWGTYSLRNVQDGSYFIQVLKLVLEHAWSKGKGIEQVLKKVQIVMRHVRQNRFTNIAPRGSSPNRQELAQSPGYYSHLSMELILVPK